MQHETVGWRFRCWDSAIYVCARYDHTGFWMRCVVGIKTAYSHSGLKYVSERVVGQERSVYW